MRSKLASFYFEIEISKKKNNKKNRMCIFITSDMVTTVFDNNIFAAWFSNILVS